MLLGPFKTCLQASLALAMKVMGMLKRPAGHE